MRSTTFAQVILHDIKNLRHLQRAGHDALFADACLLMTTIFAAVFHPNVPGGRVRSSTPGNDMGCPHTFELHHDILPDCGLPPVLLP
jgi:hypothetical protein